MSPFFFHFYDSHVGMNWHESYFATLYHSDNANQSNQHTFKERMGMNHTSNQFYHYNSILRGSSHSCEGGNESPIPNLEVTLLASNKKAL